MSFRRIAQMDHCATVHYRYYIQLCKRLGVKPGAPGPRQPRLQQLPPLQRKWLLGYCYGRRMRGGLR